MRIKVPSEGEVGGAPTPRKQNLTPDMLEDEPDLRVQLIALKRKLTASLALVDQTLATLDKDQP